MGAIDVETLRSPSGIKSAFLLENDARKNAIEALADFGYPKESLWKLAACMLGRKKARKLPATFFHIS